jgi:hypothetical protein
VKAVVLLVRAAGNRVAKDVKAGRVKVLHVRVLHAKVAGRNSGAKGVRRADRPRADRVGIEAIVVRGPVAGVSISRRISTSRS